MTLTSTLRNTGKAVADRLAIATGVETDVLDTLKKEHDEVAAMLKKLVDSDSAPERKKLLQQIKSALVPHVRAEEKIVYDAILTVRGGGDKAKTDGEEGYLEHEMADRMLAKLGKIANVKSPEFTAAAKVLKELVQHHVEEEERNVWADVRQHFTASQRIAMNAKYEAAKKRVKIPA